MSLIITRRRKGKRKKGEKEGKRRGKIDRERDSKEKEGEERGKQEKKACHQLQYPPTRRRDSRCCLHNAFSHGVVREILLSKLSH